ncbi:TATA-binding protein-associated factor TAF14 [Ascoidea rubescens DSM 1968]|uniref:SAS complex, SAS5 subunit/transcription initiation factor IID, subunit 14 n=1 Tax=Ascoidea rubescens DSM 1968 TaxID=1344418 RepID=A0A1D2VES0_9ASCO|nr:SAS complex, SAS5 subunit/transcription initiation factor IID, subunit 14 [Ascoidea rubescens DSM 1968]ODV60115.1 SAS complex, SAS5 subunit/transcription initiation factor IID, subunit 14 [Ascoidea rubescens DSM 1968]
MAEVKRTVRITTTQNIIAEKTTAEVDYPLRRWSIEITLLDLNGNEMSANIFDKVTYVLHPTFDNPTRNFKKPPFRIEEQGWGEFDMKIIFHLSDKAGEKKINHDLNFKQNKYINDHIFNLPISKPKFARLLLDSGPVPGYDSNGHNISNNTNSSFNNNSINNKIGNPLINNGSSAINNSLADFTTVGEKRKNNTSDLKNKKQKTSASSSSNFNSNNDMYKLTAMKGSVNLEKLANGLTKLTEDELLSVVQMVTDNRTQEMTVNNNTAEGEFTMDLYTFPDALLKSLWEYIKKRTDV